MGHAAIDPAALQRIREGDAEAQRQLVFEQAPDLYGFFRRALASDDVATDLALQALDRLLRLQAAPVREGERARLYRIAHPLLKKAREEGLRRPSPDPGAGLVAAAVAKLPDLPHDVLFLRLGVGLSLPAVAFVLGMPHEPARGLVRQGIAEPLAAAFAESGLGGCMLGGAKLVANVLDVLNSGDQMMLASHLSGCEACKAARAQIEQQLVAAAAMPALANPGALADRLAVRLVTGEPLPKAEVAAETSYPPPSGPADEAVAPQPRTEPRSEPEPEAEPEPRPEAPPIDWRIHVGAIAAAVVLVVLAWAQAQRFAPPAPKLALTVQTGAECAPGTPLALAVSLKEHYTAQPAANVGVRAVLGGVKGGQDPVLLDAKTPESGRLEKSVTCPDLPDGTYPVVVEARRGDDERVKVERTLTIGRRLRLSLSSDKPMYKPGQTMKIRALARDAVGGKVPPAGTELSFTFVDGKGNKVGREKRALDAYGVAAVEFPLATELLTGAWKIEASAASAGAETLEVTVDRYDLPQFEVKATPEKKSYKPGETVSGRVDCRYFFGKPVAGASVELELLDEKGAAASKAKGTTDEAGAWSFQLTTSQSMRRPAGSPPLRLTAKVKAKTGEAVQRQQSLAVLDEDLEIHAAVDGGALAPGVPARLYVMVVRPDGEKVPRAKVEVDPGDGQQAVVGETGADGVALVEIARPPRGQVQVRASAPDGARASLSYDVSARWAEALVRTERVFFGKGEAVSGEILSSRPSPAWQVALVREGQVLASRMVVADQAGRFPFSIDVPPGVEGAVGLVARDASPAASSPPPDVVPSRPIPDIRNSFDGAKPRGRPVAPPPPPVGLSASGKTVLIGSTAALSVSVTGDADDYRPGKEAKLTVRVVDESGKPAVANVGLSVVDESVFALVDKDPAALKTAFLLSKELLASKLPVELGKVLAADQNADRAAAMLLSLSSPTFPPSPPTFASDEGAGAREYDRRHSREIGALAQAVARALLLLVLLVAAAAVASRQHRALGPLLGLVAAAVVAYACFGPDSYPLGVALGLACVFAGALVATWSLMGSGTRIPLTISCVLIVLGTLWSGRERLASMTPQAEVPWLFGAEHRLRAEQPEPWQRRDADEAKFEALGKSHANSRKSLAPAEVSDFAGARPPPPAPAAAPGPAMMGMQAESKSADAARSASLAAEQEPAAPPPPEQARLPGAPPAIDKAATRVRTWFPETMFWSPGVVTGADGTASVQVPVADSITTWRITAQGSAADGRMGTGRGSLRVMQDFFVEVDLPVALVVGDEVELPIAVHNYLKEPQNVRLEVEKADWYEALSPSEKILSLAPGEVGAAPVRIRARQFGLRTLTVWAAGTKLKDAVRRQVEVVPQGVPREQAAGGVLVDQARVSAKLPDGFVAGSGKALLRLYPGPVATAMEGIEALLQAPHGCFEQTSATTYPNALVLRYLKASGRQGTAAEARANALLRDGYQRLVTFEVSGGGFEWFGRAPANRVLTAYGLLELSDMAQVFQVDEALLDRTRAWLVSQQARDGSWAPDAHRATGVLRGGDPLTTTAYVAWALAESGYRGPALERAARWLDPRVKTSNDPYVLALVAQVFARTGRDANGLAGKLKKLGTRDAAGRLSFASGGATAMVSRGEVARIEATALAAAALERLGDVASVGSAVDWLLTARDGRGSWHSTQATVLALRACLSTAGGGAGGGEAEVTVRAEGGEQKVSLRPDEADLVQTIDLTKFLKPDGTIVVDLSRRGSGRTFWQLTTTCYVPKPRPPQDLLVSVDWGGKKALATGDAVEAKAQVRWKRATPAGMVIVSLPVPAAFQPDAAALEALVADEMIARYSLEGRRVLVYLDGMAASSRIEFGYRLKAVNKAKVTAPPAFVALFYEPEVQAHSEAAKLEVN